MEIEKLSKSIDVATHNFKRIKEILCAGRKDGRMPFLQIYIQTVLDYKEYLTSEQLDEFENILMPMIQQISTFENALVERKKSNLFLRLPIIKTINNHIEDKKRQKLFEEMHIKDRISDDTVKFMTSQKKRELAQKEIVVISDLHGRIDKWEMVKQKINRNPLQKFIILGDAMDRGDYGLEILLEIKELSDQGKVQYLPGNHDVFAYNYLTCRGTNDSVYTSSIFNNAKKSLEYNGGQTTINKLENFDQVMRKQLAEHRISKAITLQELTHWLGQQPIQTIVHENGINYALAHAIFDTDLYNIDKNFNLEKALKIQLKRWTNRIVK